MEYIPYRAHRCGARTLVYYDGFGGRAQRHVYSYTWRGREAGGQNEGEHPRRRTGRKEPEHKRGEPMPQLRYTGRV